MGWKLWSTEKSRRLINTGPERELSPTGQPTVAAAFCAREGDTEAAATEGLTGALGTQGRAELVAVSASLSVLGNPSQRWVWASTSKAPLVKTC